MAQIVAINARGLLTQLARQAKAKALNLDEAIFGLQDAIQTVSFVQGRIYISTSGGGQSHSFLIPQIYTAGMSPERVAAQFQEFIEIWNDCFSGYGGTVTPTITDASDIDSDLAAMLADDRLQTVSSRRLDVTGIRFPGGSIMTT